MTMQFRDIATQAAADGAISAEEILLLRQAVWSSGRIEPEEVEAIFVVNDRLAATSPEWSDFFVEALVEFIVNGAAPHGYVSEAQADWLIARIDHNGALESMTELELLVRLFERAESTPQRLRDYALAQIERAVLTGEGPTRGGGMLEKGRVSAAEAALMRRIVFSSGSERPAAVSRSEAELLFRIKDASPGGNNAPEWKRLFVQGVGNYLMGFCSHEPLSPARAAELEAFMTRPPGGIGGFLSRMARGDIGAALAEVFAPARPERDHAAQVAAERALTDAEDMWLQDRIDADDVGDEYEQALLDFIAEETGAAR